MYMIILLSTLSNPPIKLSSQSDTTKYAIT